MNRISTLVLILVNALFLLGCAIPPPCATPRTAKAALPKAYIPAHSASVTLAWNASEGTNLAGYHVYYGGASASYTNTVDAGTNTQATIPGLLRGATYFFAATAYDSTGLESDYSNEISYTIPGAPMPPDGLHVTGLLLTVISAPGVLGPWSARTNVPPFLVYDPLPVEFFRLVACRTNFPQSLP